MKQVTLTKESGYYVAYYKDRRVVRQRNLGVAVSTLRKKGYHVIFSEEVAKPD